jgi:hypothetical protein
MQNNSPIIVATWRKGEVKMLIHNRGYYLFITFVVMLAFALPVGCGKSGSSSRSSAPAYSTGSGSGTGSGTGSNTGTGSGGGYAGNEAELYCLELTNAERQKEGVQPLEWEPYVAEIAKWFAQDKNDNDPQHMQKHYDSEGRLLDKRFADFGFTNYSTLGENIDWGVGSGTAGADKAMSEWMAETEIMMLRITMVNKSTAVAQIEGRLCGYFARRAVGLFESCVRYGIKSLVIDMKNCFSIDSLGIELLRKLSFLKLRLVNMNSLTRETCRTEMPSWPEVDGIGTVTGVLKSLNAKVTTNDQIVLYDFAAAAYRDHNDSSSALIYA